MTVRALCRSSALVAALACGDGPAALLITAPGLRITPCETALDAIGATCQLRAVVRDSAGAAIDGGPIMWRSLDTTVVTVTAEGLIQAIANGRATVTASTVDHDGGLEVEVRQVATAVTKVSGDAQVGTVGQLLAQPLVARAIDRLGHPVSGASVFYRVTRGTGLLTSSSATTGSDGRASVRWTLGPEPGNQTVVASVTVGQVTPAQYTAVARE